MKDVILSVIGIALFVCLTVVMWFLKELIRASHDKPSWFTSDRRKSRSCWKVYYTRIYIAIKVHRWAHKSGLVVTDFKCDILPKGEHPDPVVTVTESAWNKLKEEKKWPPTL